MNNWFVRWTGRGRWVKWSIVVIVLALGVICLAAGVQRWRVQRRAAREAADLRTATEHFGGHARGNNAGGVEFGVYAWGPGEYDRPMVDEDLERVASTPGLSFLDLSQAYITDVGLAHLARATGLRRLILAGPDVTDSGLDSIATLEGLESLELAQTAVTDAGIARLRSIKGLRGIDVSETSIGDAGSESLSACNKELRGVAAKDCDNITDSGVTALCGLPHLKRLVVSGKRITGGIAMPLSQCRTSKEVYLEVGLTDAELALLAQLPNLTDVGFAGPNCTESGLRALGRSSRLEIVVVSKSSLIDHTVQEAVAKAYPAIDWRFFD